MGGMGMAMPVADFLEPLTTIFTPPSDRNLSPTYTLGSGNNDSVIGDTYYRTLVHGYTSSCLPKAAWENIYLPLQVNFVVGYSPGLCPSGWYTATANIDPPQTTAWRCPESYGYESASYAYSFNCSTSMSTAYVVSDDLTSTYTRQWGIVRGIAVTQADSDKALLASATAPSSTTTSASTAANSDSSSLSTTATPGASISTGISPTATYLQRAEPESKLAPGTVAGIAIGAVIGVLLIIGIVIFFLWRKRRQRKATSNQSQVINSDKFEKAELSGEPKQVPELKATHLYEADGTGRPGEMSDANVRAELEGDWRGWEVPAQDR